MHSWEAGEQMMNSDNSDMIIQAAADVPTHYDVLPDGEPTVVIGNPQGDTAFNHQQGDNPYGFQQDCGLVSSMDVLNQFGIPASEGDVVQHAIENGECNIDTSDLSMSGGTTADMQAQILTDYGVPAHVEQGGSLDSLAEHIQMGQSVIIEANAGYLWQDPNYVDNGGANHAVTVTGVARDPVTGQIQGFYINDSGTGQSDEFVSAQTMQQAWVDVGGASVVTDQAHQ